MVAVFQLSRDYIFAKAMIEVGLSEKHADRLIMIVNCYLDGKGLFTLRNFAEVEVSWERCASFMSEFDLSLHYSILYDERTRRTRH